MPAQAVSYTAVVPGAGIGTRMRSSVPKQYLKLAGKTILEHCLENLITHPRIDRIVLCLQPQDPWFKQLELTDKKWLTTVEGGAQRADSVLNGLAEVTDSQWVLVHDAARPCLPHKDLDMLLTLADKEHGGILAMPVRDTMKRANEQGLVTHTEDRNHLWHALTPQFFRCAELKSALTQALAKGVQITDEASAIEWAGGQVQLVPGNPCNIKITHPEDLALAEFYLQHMTQQREQR
ncbi:2-C-methyl-D-erythritol 4-phosphate cytidylyltransferase [Lacimicrobium sp. SS2-24]|uniref:2-C-methyl-D-erythritol 4-phosphate cytidylyltransferase n=1 Tax=Lacimicrobium sp. SS2-24 TaxID=2005569 RepID=UPI000B4BEAB4|nr:2-C-methyl-D-erythritol 4-phosphate cytidylyltransferase [Lacimicrobium sp. SS2-24]